jgi:gas vesicle protein
MKLVLLLIACFAFAAQADVIDDIKAKFQEFGKDLDKVGKAIKEKGQAAIDAIKSHINPATLAELDVYKKLCPDNQVVKRDLKDNEHVKKACAYIKENWPKLKAKFDEIKQKAEGAWSKFADEIASDFYILRIAAAVKFEEAKAKLEAMNIPEKAKSMWDQFTDAVGNAFDKVKEAAKKGWSVFTDKFGKFTDEAKEKLEKLKEAAEAKWEIIKGKVGSLTDDAKAELEKIEQAVKPEVESFKEDIQKAKEEIKRFFNL